MFLSQLICFIDALFSCSSMAIEHFDEKIVPDLKRSRPGDANISIASIYDLLMSPRPGPSYEMDLTLSQDTSFDFQKEAQKRSKSSFCSISKLIIKKHKKQSKIIKNQSKQISKMMKNMKQMKRRLDETETQNREMLESVKQLKVSTKPLNILKKE